jgi:hypothetical protein
MVRHGRDTASARLVDPVPAARATVPGAGPDLSAFSASPTAAAAAELNSRTNEDIMNQIDKTELAAVAGGFNQAPWIGPFEVIRPEHYNQPPTSPWWPYPVLP